MPLPLRLILAPPVGEIPLRPVRPVGEMVLLPVRGVLGGMILVVKGHTASLNPIGDTYNLSVTMTIIECDKYTPQLKLLSSLLVHSNVTAITESQWLVIVSVIGELAALSEEVDYQVLTDRLSVVLRSIATTPAERLSAGATFAAAISSVERPIARARTHQIIVATTLLYKWLVQTIVGREPPVMKQVTGYLGDFIEKNMEWESLVEEMRKGCCCDDDVQWLLNARVTSVL